MKLEPHDISIAIETEENKIYYIHWSEMTPAQKNAFIGCLKNESYKEVGDLIKNIERSHFFNRSPITSTSPSILDPPTMIEPPQKLEQTSLGQTEDFSGAELDVENVYKKAKEGCEKALRLIGEWSNQGDKKAKIFLIEISKTPERRRERVLIL